MNALEFFGLMAVLAVLVALARLFIGELSENAGAVDLIAMLGLLVAPVTTVAGYFVGKQAGKSSRKE